MTSKTTVLAVVIGLGILGLISICGATWLSHDAIAQPTVDPAAVALIAGLTGLAGTCIGALAGVLASTRSTLGPKDTEPSTFQATVTSTPITVTPSGNPQGTTR
jgi:hypothetical protein